MNSKASNLFSTLQQVGKSLMTPVSVLPAAGLLVAFGRIFDHFLLGKLMFSGGIAIFEQLPVVFAIGVAIGFTGGAGVAGLASAVGYFTLINVLKVMKEYRVLTVDINTGVFGGIIIGLLAAYLYKRFYQTKLHPVLGFFAGKRFVPIVTAAAAVFVGVALGFIWPPIQHAINAFGTHIMGSDYGPAFYAAGKRLLIPVGLHHVFYPPFLYEFGEYATATGQILRGEAGRYFAGDPSAGRFMASEFPLMLFGLPAACYAMYLRAPATRRKAVAGIMITAALTSIITGITEPIEFSFIFVAPVLYFFHVAAAFLSGLLTGFFDIHLGYTFSASLIDYVVGTSNMKNSIYLWLVVGPIIGLLYFSAFYWLIGLMNIKTPGRDDEAADDQMDVSSSQKSAEILAALGGSENIITLDACITRLRLSVKDPSRVNQDRLKRLGAAGLMVTGNNFQVIFGVESDTLKEEIKSLMMSSAKNGEIKSSAVYFSSPLKGEILSLAQVPDATFADKILGDGFAVRPTEGVVYAPVAGKIAQLFRTNHAIGVLTEEGLEILIHVGIDTVKMNGDGFTPFVKKGDTVVRGQKILEFDLDLVRAGAKSDITPVLVTNMGKVTQLNVLKTGVVTLDQKIMEVFLK
ncbi:MAG: glucose PTS transporter subunit IIA [Bacteriovorax sp.]|nr:glucose PTS transporter subunit IIA [Bacteriovorax sp.]